jgi:hypothetical protein
MGGKWLSAARWLLGGFFAKSNGWYLDSHENPNSQSVIGLRY